MGIRAFGVSARGRSLEVDAGRGVVRRRNMRERTSLGSVGAGVAEEFGADGEVRGVVDVGTCESEIASACVRDDAPLDELESNVSVCRNGGRLKKIWRIVSPKVAFSTNIPVFV